MPMYNLIEYSDIIQKRLKVCRDEPNSITKDSESFKFKSKSLDNTGIINPKIAVPLKYLNNFWRTLEMTLINCKINLILTWTVYCVISEGNRVTTFAITYTKLYVPLVTLSAQENRKFLLHLKSGLKRTINWNINQK